MSKSKIKTKTSAYNDCIVCLSDAKFFCSGCKNVWYCSRKCQKHHWKNEGHKLFCKEIQLDTSIKASDDTLSSDKEECSICLEKLDKRNMNNLFIIENDGCFKLECGHTFHSKCLNKLRKFGINNLCPMCRRELPSGPNELHENATRMYLQDKKHKNLEKIIKMLEDAIKQGNILSYNTLGVIYSDQNNLDKALKYFNEGIKHNHSLAIFNSAQCNLKIGNFSISKKLYHELILKKEYDSEYYRSCNNLADIYLKNNQFKEASKYFQEAIKGKHPHSYYGLGCLYFSGQGVEKNINKAITNIKISANYGYGEAFFFLGNIYENERLGSKNLKLSFESYKKGSDNNVKCMFNCANMLLDGIGIKQNTQEAFKYYKIIADKDFSDAEYYDIKDIILLQAKAQFKVGNIYYYKEKFKEAYFYYSKATQQNISEAFSNIGNMYYKGEYLKPNLENAIKNHKIAIELGNIKSIFNLATIYMRNKDFEMSEKYFKLHLKKDPNNIDSTFSYGYTLFQNNKIHEAKKILEKIKDSHTGASSLINLSKLTT